MKTIILGLVLATACGTAASTSTHRDTLDSIPKAASDALRKASGGAKIDHVERELEGGVELFEASWKVNGLEREVAVTADGTIVETEEEMAPASVPEPVKFAAVQALPKGAAIKYIKLMSGNIEAEALVDGREHEVTLSPDGKPAKGDDDDDDDDDDND